jgi:hypothetical protein
MTAKTIPLSLHTRRVVGVLAIQLVLDHVSRLTVEQAVDHAFDLLGYPEDNPDNHGIRALVLADVQKQFPTRTMQVAA